MASAIVAIPGPSASATPYIVNVDYQCLTSAPSLGGNLVRQPQVLQVGIDAPVAGAPGSTVPVVVTVNDITPYRHPLSPPVALADVTVKLQVSVDIVQNALNTPPAQAVASTSSISGLDTVGVFTANQALNTPWASVPSVSMNLLLPNSPGDRLWLRPGQLDFQFSATGGANPLATAIGTTTCLPINPSEVLPGSTVTAPTYGIYSRYNAPAPMRIGILGVPLPPATDTCTAQTGDNTGGTGCITGQNANALLTSGNLTQQARKTGTNPNSTTIEMGAVTVASTTQILTAPMNSITVADLRGGTYGWTLSASLAGPLIDEYADTIQQGQLQLGAITCTGDANSAGSTAGTGGSLGTTQTLCSVAAGAQGPNQSGSGIYDVTATMTLNIPAFQHHGQYTGLLDVHLV